MKRRDAFRVYFIFHNCEMQTIVNNLEMVKRGFWIEPENFGYIYNPHYGCFWIPPHLITHAVLEEEDDE